MIVCKCSGRQMQAEGRALGDRSGGRRPGILVPNTVWGKPAPWPRINPATVPFPALYLCVPGSYSLQTVSDVPETGPAQRATPDGLFPHFAQGGKCSETARRGRQGRRLEPGHSLCTGGKSSACCRWLSSCL